MSLRRLISVSGSVLGVTIFATSAFVAAAPAKKKPPAKPATPVAPAKDPGTGSAAGGAAGGGTGSAAGGGDASGSAVQPIEDTPPSDMNGTNENPDNPHAMTNQPDNPIVVAPVVKSTGYPIQEVLRPLTLPQNMTEISIAPHLQVSPFLASDALHVRYGITSKVQLSLSYLYFGAYNRNLVSTASSKIGFHSGKTFGVDVTVMLQNWIGVRVGVPLYIDPVAFGLQIGVPIKFVFADKFSIGGLDDLLQIRLSKFAPSLYQEAYNAIDAQHETTNTEQSNGHLRFSFYGEYQHDDKVAIIGRIGIDSDLGATSGGGGAGTSSNSGTQTFIKAGLQYSPRKYFDIGGQLGWDDLSTLGTFGPQLFLALRI